MKKDNNDEKEALEKQVLSKKFGRWLYIEKIFFWNMKGFGIGDLLVDASEKRYFCHCTGDDGV